MLDHLQDLLRHMAWADAVILNAWGKSPAQEDEDLRRRWDHIALVQEAFLKALKGEGFVWDPHKPLPTYTALKRWTGENHAAFDAYVHALTEEGAAHRFQLPWFPDPPCVLSVAQALTQISMHTQHHRGQIMTRLKDKGGVPKDVDFVVWLWRGKPLARWA